jgi:hypothetical protein
VNNRDDLPAESKQIIFDLKQLYENLAEKYNAIVTRYRSEKAGRDIIGVKTDGNNWILNLYSNGEVWFYRRRAAGQIAKYCERVLERLVAEQILDKTSETLTASQWSIRSVYFRNPDDDEGISQQLRRFVEIGQEEYERAV